MTQNREIEDSTIRNMAEAFDAKIVEGLSYKYRDAPPDIKPWLLKDDVVARVRVSQFVAGYQSQEYYPQDRLKRLVFLLTDIVTQLYFIFEVDLGLYNRLLHDTGADQKEIAANSHLLMTNLCLDQTAIVKGRILLERMMNFIYYMETGNDLERELSNNKKKHKVPTFFKSLTNTRWAFLDYVQPVLDWYDERFRTSEVHKFSRTRKCFSNSEPLEFDQVMLPIHIFLNLFWNPLQAILHGESPKIMFWDKGMEAAGIQNPGPSQGSSVT